MEPVSILPVFDNVVRHVRPQLVHIWENKLGREVAEDIAQDAVLESLEVYRRQAGEIALRPLLFRIATNRGIDRIRQRKRRMGECSLAEPGIEAVRSSIPGPELVAIQREEASRLHAAIAELPASYRDVLILREFQGLSYEEITAKMGLPLNTVKVRLCRGRRALRLQLDRCPN